MTDFQNSFTVTLSRKSPKWGFCPLISFWGHVTTFKGNIFLLPMNLRGVTKFRENRCTRDGGEFKYYVQNNPDQIRSDIGLLRVDKRNSTIDSKTVHTIMLSKCQ